MDTKTSYVYHLVAFSTEYIQAHEDDWKRNEAYTKASPEERKELRKSYKPDGRVFCGKAYRGTFAACDDAVQMIEDFPTSIHEGYYDYLVIEQYAIGELDGLNGWWDGSGEIWFKVNCGEDYWETCKYERIEKPEFLKQIVGWV